VLRQWAVLASRIRLGQGPLGGEVGIDNDFAGGTQPVLTFGCGFKGFGRGRKPLFLARSGAGQFDLNSSDGVGCHDDAVKLIVADVLTASVLSCHADQDPLADQPLRKLVIERRATIVEIGRVRHWNWAEEAYRVHPEDILTGHGSCIVPTSYSIRLRRCALKTMLVAS